MANGHGGYRRPANPAAVSGPGKLSRRTDGKQPQMPVTGQPYGQNQELQGIQNAAPLAQAAGPAPGAGPAGPAGPGQDPLAALVGLSAPSQQPDVPVTDGAALGPGVGPSAMGITSGAGATRADAQSIQPALQAMIAAADSDDASPEFRRYVRQVIASLQ